MQIIKIIIPLQQQLALRYTFPSQLLPPVLAIQQCSTWRSVTPCDNHSILLPFLMNVPCSKSNISTWEKFVLGLFFMIRKDEWCFTDSSWGFVRLLPRNSHNFVMTASRSCNHKKNEVLELHICQISFPLVEEILKTQTKQYSKSIKSCSPVCVTICVIGGELDHLYICRTCARL